NFFTAWIVAGITKITFHYLGESSMVVMGALQYAVWINLALAVFNLIPIPPLDGSHLLEAVLPNEFSDILFWLRQYGFFVLLLILLFPPTQTFLIFIIGLLYKLLL
ncbi:MAG: site-2 protease family protein, partial [Candidatus Saganbacteria bacterium]|nr:site-2 protease family protein [Candidatus Saganbacteria bacterium]